MNNFALNNKPQHAKKADIWIVDDNTLFQKCIIALINSTPDLKCSNSFVSCEDALQKMELEPYPDVLLLDIELPGISGIEGIQKFKEMSPASQIIMLTGNDDTERIFQAICAGADGYLLKDSALGKIIEAIHDVMAGGSPINTQIARKVLASFILMRLPSKNYGLTEREQEILLQMTNGLTKKEIGAKLCLSHHTIDTHVRSIYNKLHVNKRSSAVSKAIKERLL